GGGGEGDRGGGKGGGDDHNRSVTPGRRRDETRAEGCERGVRGRGGPQVGRAHTRFPCAVSARVPSPPPPIYLTNTHKYTYNVPTLHPPNIIYNIVIMLCYYYYDDGER
ncbi:hypothetical protein FWK35_00039015, partial [Aphis craccivora]